MRRPDLNDLDAATRVLLARPRADWTRVAAILVSEAHVSDRVRKRLMRAIPGRGSGALGAEAMHWRRVPPRATCDATYCAAMVEVLAALATWRMDDGRR